MKRLLPILIFLGFAISDSVAQDSRNPFPDNGKKVNFYPNPATNYITFNIQKNVQNGVSITVFNFLGKKISETQTVNENTVISLTDFNRGTYIYHIVDRSGKMIDTGKFQVSK
ncbi:MAG: T9SS type A sorting domain-containing protein [Chitinophagaceae bacterium]